MGDACHHDHADGPPAAAEVERALAVAGARLTAEGERLTPARLRVLGLLLGAGEPVKAYDLIARNRYRIFGRTDQCMVPSVEDRARFVS